MTTGGRGQRAFDESALTMKRAGPDRLRVFHLIKSLGRGGAEMLLPETHRHADHHRFHYRYGYFLPWKDAMVPVLEAQGAEVGCLSRSNSLSIVLSARHVAREITAWGTDVLHCHLPIAGVVGRIAGRMARVPVVYTEHNVLERYHPLTRRANLLTWRLQETVVAVSGDVAESLRRSASEKVPVRTVLNGVDLGRFDGGRERGLAVKRALQIPVEASIIGTVAVFRSQKRLDAWLQVARGLLDRHPDLHFLMVGDGPLRVELEAMADSQGLGHAVHWVGLQEDVRPYLAAMDIYMMSSLFEGLPVALLEAMAMRCAVLSTAVGGIPEVLCHGENGLLVDVEHPGDLADRAEELLSAPELRRRLGAAARTTVEEGFSIARMARELEEIYREVALGYSNGR